jgi:hypothetical protein
MILTAWTQSLKNHNWVQVAFFLQEAKDRKLFTDAEMGLIRAVSMASAGARGEALVELEETRKIVDAKLEPVVSLTLAKYYEDSYAAARAKAIYAAFIPPAPPAPPAPANAPASKAVATGGKAQPADRKPASQK